MMMTYRGYSITAHQFGFAVINTVTGDHCGYSDTLAQAKSVIDEIMAGRDAGLYTGHRLPA